MHEIIKFLDKYLINNCSVVCATSGGVDSMVLLNILINYCKNKNIKVICAHINHNLREESFEEYEFVKQYCTKNNIIFEGLVLDKNLSGNLESKFRNMRYEFFEKIVNKYNAKYLFTAHHGDDLVETVLMRLVRGSTLEGYSGFNKVTDCDNYKILRPLVYVTKDYIYKFAKENNIEYREDKTNQSDKYTRNRYRKYILPLLKKENKNVHKKILEYSEEVNNSYNFIHNYVEKIFNDRYYNNILDLDGILNYDDFILEKILLELFKKEYNNQLNLITKSHVNETIKIIKSDKPNLSIDLPLGKVVIKNYDILKIASKKNIKDYKIKITDTPIDLPNGGKIKKVISTTLTNNYVCHLDSSKLRLPLYVRNKKDGDYIEVLGLNGKKKVKDIFIDSKIPKEERRLYPVVVDSDENIVWIPGIKKSKYNSLKTKKYDIILWYTKEENNE